MRESACGQAGSQVASRRVAAAFAVYLFFLLLTVTLITNRLAQATKSYAE